jgi:hypothetical protein
MMGQAVKKFFDDKGIDDIRLTLIPLEGEGTIEHRVDRYVHLPINPRTYMSPYHGMTKAGLEGRLGHLRCTSHPITISPSLSLSFLLFLFATLETRFRFFCSWAGVQVEDDRYKSIIMLTIRLYKSYLSNPAWINDLRRADAIFFAAHSQGCIVTTHLISRLIAQGHIKTPLNAEAVARVSNKDSCGQELTSSVHGRLDPYQSFPPPNPNHPEVAWRTPFQSMLKRAATRKSACWPCAVFTRDRST